MSARVLIIEDKQANLDLMTYLLRAFGHQVMTAMDGGEGLVVARRERPDAILCDIHMPGTDGYAVARQLKADSDLQHIPLIAVTALAMVGDREKVLAAGFDGYIAKPITPETFVGQLESYLPPALHSAPRAEPEASSSGLPPERPKHALLLVVDDNAIELRLMYKIFDPSGYEVRMATEIETGLALTRTLRPDLIVCDVNMPGGSGFDFLAAIQGDPELSGQAVIIVTSTATTDADRKQALALGAMRYVARPIEPPALLAIIEECLAEIRKR